MINQIRSWRLSAPLIIAESDLFLTAPSMLIDYFAKLVPLRAFEPPIPLPSYPEEAYWHERYDSDPAHRFLRELLVRVTLKLGVGMRPERTRFERPKKRSKSLG